MLDPITADDVEPDDDGLYTVRVRHALLRWREGRALRYARGRSIVRLDEEQFLAAVAVGALASPDEPERVPEVDLRNPELVELVEDGNTDDVLDHVRENPDDLDAVAELEARRGKPRKGVLSGLAAIAEEIAEREGEADDIAALEAKAAADAEANRATEDDDDEDEPDDDEDE